jgi:murein DD-endopeptidase MepM/ murein hydrolase activator NlpD
LIVCLLVLGGPAFAAEVPPALRRLQTREETLAEQTGAAEQLARRNARAAYRLARLREAAFLTVPETRLEQAQTLDLALLAARRSAAEAQALRAELARVNGERSALENAAARRTSQPPADPPEGRDAPLFKRPVRGTVVGVPGLRADPVTGAEVRHQALQIIARMNEPVHPPASGTVRRVEPLPQGGFAVVVEHPGGWVSLLSGLREVQTAPGDPVDTDLPLGLAGRNLDGAVVISFELWYHRTSVDPRPLLRRRR